jgi:prepilin-type processing-associated H-X9-DG protein
MRLINGKPAGLLKWIGLLAVIFFIFLLLNPYRGSTRLLEEARYNAAKNNLGYIVKTYLGYITTSGTQNTSTAKPIENVHDVAYLLARDAQFNEASAWLIGADERLAGVSIPRAVILGDTQTGSINPDFAKLPLSYVFAVSFVSNAPPTTTPIAWTRGLQSDGTWAADSPWQGQGGHIAYLDGHVEWVDKFSSVKYGTTIPTNNIREALPPGADILSAEPNTK